MDTRLLTSFLAVLRAGGITAAAAELGFVQSTVTTHIQTLERLVGTPLLDRNPGGVSPTRAGSLLAERAQQILDLEDRMLTELTTAAAEPAGPVRLCAPESVCAYRLAPFLPGVRKRFPGIGLSLFAAGTLTALTALADRRVDLALILGPPLQPPAGVLLLEEGCSYSDELAALVASADPTTTPSRFGGIETVKRCVAAGLGLALLPTVTVADELADSRLIELQPPGDLTPQHLWLAWPSSRWRSPAVRAVHAAVRQITGGQAR